MDRADGRSGGGVASEQNPERDRRLAPLLEESDRAVQVDLGPACEHHALVPRVAGPQKLLQTPPADLGGATLCDLRPDGTHALDQIGFPGASNWSHGWTWGFQGTVPGLLRVELLSP